MEVTTSNKFIDSDSGNAFVVGLLTLSMLVALETAVSKIVFKSKVRSTKVVIRKEIFSRLSGWREIKEMLSGVDYKEEDLDKNSTGDFELAPRKVYPRRLILPVLCRLFLLTIEIVMIALSGEMLIFEGNGTLNSFSLVPSDGKSINLVGGCRDELPEKRSTAMSGKLMTCTTILRSEGPGTPRTGSLEIRAVRTYATNKLQFSFWGTGGSKFRTLAVDSIYQSYDGFVQTLLPFDEVPEGFEGPGNKLRDKAEFRIETLNQIYDRLADKLSVPKERRAQNFQEERTVIEASREYIAKFDGEFDQDVVVDALSSVILTHFKISSETGEKKLVSFNERTGLYGPELGKGPRLLQKNIVPNWVWVLCIILLAAVAAVFDRVNCEDPEFYTFRAFVEVNGMDSMAGPLALPIRPFPFGRSQASPTERPQEERLLNSDDVGVFSTGHIGFGPPKSKSRQFTEEAEFQNVHDI